MAKQREDFSEPPGARGLTARKQGGLLPVSLAGDVWSGVRRLWDLLASERRCPACASVYAFGDQKETLFCPECSLALTRREKGHCPDCGEPAAWPDLPLADERNVFLRDALVDVHGSIMDLPKGANNIQFATFLANTVFCAFQSNRYSLTRDQPELDM